MEGPIFGGAYLQREIYFSKWIGLKVEFTEHFALFYFVFKGNIPSTSPRRAHICRGDLTEDFSHYPFGGLIFGGGGGGLIHGGAYFWNFCGMPYNSDTTCLQSRKQNIRFLISISTDILKLMVKITSIFCSYRFSKNSIA